VAPPGYRNENCLVPMKGQSLPIKPGKQHQNRPINCDTERKNSPPAESRATEKQTGRKTRDRKHHLEHNAIPPGYSHAHVHIT